MGAERGAEELWESQSILWGWGAWRDPPNSGAGARGIGRCWRLLGVGVWGPCGVESTPAAAPRAGSAAGGGGPRAPRGGGSCMWRPRSRREPAVTWELPSGPGVGLGASPAGFPLQVLSGLCSPQRAAGTLIFSLLSPVSAAQQGGALHLGKRQVAPWLGGAELAEIRGGGFLPGAVASPTQAPGSLQLWALPHFVGRGL